MRENRQTSKSEINRKAKKQTASTVPRKRKRKKDHQRRNLLITLIVLFLAGTAVALSLTVFFPVESIQVEGNVKYDAVDIISCSELSFEKNLFLTDTGLAKNKILNDMPYVYSVEIKKQLPSTIVIIITETEPVAYMSASSGGLLLDQYGRALEYTGEVLNQNLVYIEGIEEGKINLGDTIGNEETNQVQAYQKLIQSFITQEIISQISVLDLSDVFNIKFIYEDRLHVSIGNITSVEEKIEYFSVVLNELGESAKGTLDISSAQKASYIPGT